MKRLIPAVAILLLVVAGYGASGYVGLYRLAAAVDRRDVAAASERIDFPRVRQSFTSQIIATYLTVTGKRVSGFGVIIAGAGMSLAEPIVAEVMSAERLIDLLQTGDVPIGVQQPASLGGPLASGTRADSLWISVSNSSFGFGNFNVWLPPKAPHHEKFVLHFKLSQWRWKLFAITLPEPVRVRLARELQKTIK